MEKEKEKNKVLQLVGFKLGKEEFGIDILIVLEIIRMINITEMPNAPEFVEGIVNLRGKIIPVINLRKKLDLPATDYNDRTRIIVINVKGKNVGFVVDEVSEVLRVESQITEPPPDIVSGIKSEYISGIVKLEDRLLILLDIETLM